MKKFFQEIFSNIFTSFIKASKGEENLSNVIWFWGVIGYCFSYFILNKIVLVSNNSIVDFIICWAVLIYFVWHIYTVTKCAPKKKKMNKEEKAKLQKVEARSRTRSIFNKIISREPITKWNPVSITIIIDLLFIAHFGGYLLR